MLKSFLRIFTRKKSLHSSTKTIRGTKRQNRGGEAKGEAKGRARPIFHKTLKSTKGMNCSPMVQRSKLDKSCYTPHILNIIRDEYNKSHPTSPIKSDDARIIWEQLREKLQCGKEDCWLNQIQNTRLRTQIDRYVFAPDKPPEWKKDKNAWLSNYDILNVLEQYEYTHKEFEFLGPAPIDFDKNIGDKCVSDELCKFDLKTFLNKGKTQIGIILNTDIHTGEGYHWVSLYIDTKDRFIFFFDSNGDPPQPEAANLATRIQKQAAELNMEFEYVDNQGVRHQNSNTECGMYSLFFIITMLTRRTHKKANMTKKERWDLFLEKEIPDKYVNQYRRIYFNG